MPPNCENLFEIGDKALEILEFKLVNACAIFAKPACMGSGKRCPILDAIRWISPRAIFRPPLNPWPIF